jgi:hypothetical protein
VQSGSIQQMRRHEWPLGFVLLFAAIRLFAYPGKIGCCLSSSSSSGAESLLSKNRHWSPSPGCCGTETALKLRRRLSFVNSRLVATRHAPPPIYEWFHRMQPCLDSWASPSTMSLRWPDASPRRPNPLCLPAPNSGSSAQTRRNSTFRRLCILTKATRLGQDSQDRAVALNKFPVF